MGPRRGSVPAPSLLPSDFVGPLTWPLLCTIEKLLDQMIVFAVFAVCLFAHFDSCLGREYSRGQPVMAGLNTSLAFQCMS